MPLAEEPIGVHDQLYKKPPVERSAELMEGPIFFVSKKLWFAAISGAGRVADWSPAPKISTVKSAVRR
jgi:hypothetical protein